MKMNVAWHQKNRMPKNASLDERVKWHLVHSKNCKCRPMSEKILDEIKKRGLI